MTSLTWPRVTVAPARIGSDHGPTDRPRWARLLDAAIGGGIAAFALWTLLYEAGLMLHWPVVPLTIVWLVAGPAVGILVGRAVFREELRSDAQVGVAAARSTAVDSTNPRLHAVMESRRLGTRALSRIWPAGLLAVGAAVLVSRTTGLWSWCGWALAVIALIWIAVDLRRSTLNPEPRSLLPIESRNRVPALIGLIGLIAGAGSLFVYRISADDAYYVNLSTWVAEHGHFPLRDTMFSNQVFPTSYGGGFPISSVEGLIGALARVAQVSAPTMAYLVITPILAFVSVWVLGQLAWLWTPRHTRSVFVFSLLFVLIGTDSAYRAYSIFDIWQGKSAAIAILLPLIWAYATRIIRSSRAYGIGMLAVVGTAFIGLTSTAAILAPAIAGALLLAAALLRNRRLAAGAVALVVAPLLGGLVVATMSQSVGGPHPKAPSPWDALHHAYGKSDGMVLLTLVAILLGPLLLRSWWPRVLAWSAAAVPALLLLPGVLGLGNLVTGAGPVEWRLLLVPPVPTLVGVLIVAAIRAARHQVRHHRRVRITTTAILGVVALLVLSFADGTSPQHADLHVSGTVTWKAWQPALGNVSALLATEPPRGRPILMPAHEMIILSWYTTQWHAVAPRPLYVDSLHEPAPLKSARMTLVRLAFAKHGSPPRTSVVHALKRLDVGTVCLAPSNHTGQKRVRSAGFSPFARIGTLRCATRADAS